MDFEKLAEPFEAKDIEWRIAQKGAKDGKPWAKVLAYVTNRAIMNRLDEVCGPGGWCNQFQHLQGAFLCGIGIKVNGEWVYKWDGAQESQIEATKGGISGSMKRAAVQWGIGRYLYDLTEGWADISSSGAKWVAEDKKNGAPTFKWNPPQLPLWALPEKADKAKRKEEIKKQIADAKFSKEINDIAAKTRSERSQWPQAWQDGMNDLLSARCAEFEMS